MGSGELVQDTSGQSVRVSIVGASGYTGLELLRLLLNHRFVRLSRITSRQHKGKKLSEVSGFFLNTRFSEVVFDEFDPEVICYESDVVFCCLPHGTSFPVVKQLFEVKKDIRIIDFSADFRLKNPEVYERFYGIRHGAIDLLKDSVYGLPEIFADSIKNSSLVANPGCYPTSVLLALYPVVKESVVDLRFPIIVDSKSGVSGAGKKLREDLLYCEVNESFKPYAIRSHRHLPEILENLGIDNVRFVPHLIPSDRGIVSTIYFLSDCGEEDVSLLYESFCRERKFLRFKDKPSSTKDVVGTNFCDISVTRDDATGVFTIVSVIDNLVKGASGQAIQNMNIICGFNEWEGLLAD